MWIKLPNGGGLCYYKFCVLSHLLEETDYDNYCLIDVDTYCTCSFEYLWREVEHIHRVFVYNNFEGYCNHNRTRFIEEFKRLYGRMPLYSEHYSTGGIVGAKSVLIEFMEAAWFEMQSILENKFESDCGDEFILFCVQENKPDLFFCGNAYFENFYTIEGYHVITTKFAFEQIPIWHMLFEKTGGMLAMYKYINKYNRLPAGRKLWRIIGLLQPDKNFGTFGWLVRRIKARTARLLEGNRL